MIETRIDALDFLVQLADEIVFDYEAEDETITTIVIALLAFQTHAIPIILGTIQPVVTRSISVQQDTILNIITGLRNTVGGYIEVDIDRKLNWWNDIGEDKGQQIRYKKNIKGLSRTLEYTNFGNRLYCYGEGEGSARIHLSQAAEAYKLVGRDNAVLDATYPEDSICMSKFTATATGNVIAMRFRARNAAAGNIYIGMYADAAGAPAALLGQKEVAVTSGVERAISVALDSAIPVVSGTAYWIAINSNAPIVGAKMEISVRKYKDYAYGPLPNPAGVGYTDNTTDCGITAGIVDYVEDITSQGAYGICIRQLTDKSITDPDVLLAWANLKLAEMKAPRHSYRVDMVNLAAMGWDFEALQLGSMVKVIDEDMGIDIDARIVKIIRDLSDPGNIQVEISNPGKDIIDTMEGVYDTQQFQDHIATKIGAGQVTVLGAFSVIDWVTGGTTNIKGDYIRTGTIQSTNWGVGAGSQFNLNDGTFKLGGSASPKLSWNGTTLSVTGAIIATSGEFTGTLKVTNLQAGSGLTVYGTIIAGGGGVKISSTGINIFGLGNALTTRATEAGTIQCYVGADGKFYAGAGAVILDSTGMIVKGETAFILKNANNVACGYFASYIAGGNWMGINTYPGVYLSIDSGEKLYLGAGSGFYIHCLSPFRLKQGTDPGSPLEGWMYYNLAAHTVKYWNGSVWKTLATV